MWQLFAEQTNIYANQFLAASTKFKPQSWARTWIDTNLTEMKTLTGLLILPRIVQKPQNGIILVSWLWEDPMCSTVFQVCHS
jgi:hypothetical protein